MAVWRTDCATSMVGAIVIEGYQVLANYKNEFILAQALNLKNPEPWVVWNLDNDGVPYGGNHCASPKSAQVCFVERCFPWFWEEAEKGSPLPETLIDFTQEYTTHRIGFYNGWIDMHNKHRKYAI